MIKSVVQRERISGTVGSDCNEEDMLGSAQSYIVLCIVLLFESFIVLPFFFFVFTRTFSQKVPRSMKFKTAAAVTARLRGRNDVSL